MATQPKKSSKPHYILQSNLLEIFEADLKNKYTFNN
jgi:hypothetical protein